jgi:hypothetical protein
MQDLAVISVGHDYLLHSSIFNYTSALDLKQPDLAEIDNRDASHEGFRVPAIRIFPN